MVSIIVPVYKSELTLTRCVESLLGQDYTDIEVILIVDGPPDGSGVLADELAKRDERVRVIHQSNQGVSKARNAGLQQAKGEYIRFVDSDDYVLPGELSLMVDAMQKDQSDIVIAGYHHLYYGSVYSKLPQMQGSFVTKDHYDIMKALYEKGFLNMPWNKLFKKELVTELFPTDINLGEDLLFNLAYISNTEKFSVLQEHVCEYIQDDRGTTLSTKKRDDRIQLALLLKERTQDFFVTLFGPRDFLFLDEKVVTTLLDELESVPFLTMSKKEKMDSFQIYADALLAYAKENHRENLHLALPDYRMIFRQVMRGNFRFAYTLSVLRSLVVKVVRKVKKT